MPSRSRSREAAQSGKGREILGICLLGLGVFCGLSLISLHGGSGTMMGPGGRAAASGLYALAGWGAYLLVGVLLVVAARVFRGLAWHRSFGELCGIVGFVAGSTVLLHLAFGGATARPPGPGGFLGGWLGDLATGFFGTVGAGLLGSVVLMISAMVLTSISLAEGSAVGVWIARQSVRALVVTARGLGRLLVAMFPRKSSHELLPALEAQDPFQPGAIVQDEGHEDDDDDRDQDRDQDRDEDGDDDRHQDNQVHLRSPDDTDQGGHHDVDEDDDLDRRDFDGHAEPLYDRSSLGLEDTVRMTADELHLLLPSARPDGRLTTRPNDRTMRGMPAAAPPGRVLARASARPAPVLQALPPMESDAVLVGRSSDPAIELHADDLHLFVPDDDPLSEDDLHRPRAPARQAARRPASALIAEVSAVECAALAPPAEDRRGAGPPVPLPVRETPVAPPVIVTPVDQLEVRAIVDSQAAARQRPRVEPPAEERGRKVEGPGFIRLSDGDFVLPPSDLLVYEPPPAQEIDKKALYDMAARLEQAMANYGVKGNVSAINMGPVVTMYEFAPAPGTRTGKVAQLENDLAMALEAQAVRIVAPIPGKAVVGVEVPNRNRQMVYLKEILAEESMRGAFGKLQIAMGKDIKGNPVSVNLSKMPHLLVAGTTGSGKSVTVNGMITSILYNATPEDVRFIMVDPKMLELSIYEGIPHLLLPVVTDPKKANLALRWAVDEMERRYELLAKSGVRDISSYNAKLEVELGRRPGASKPGGGPAGKVSTIAARDGDAAARHGKRLKVMITAADGSEQEIEVDGGTGLPIDDTLPITEEMREEISTQAAAAQAAAEQAQQADNRGGKEELPRKLPYIVIVIDEFADLMMVAPKDVETSVARLAQKARAAGLHLILATQRPSVDVITGLIKANFPSRVALQVASKIDSRTILDQSGAETLLGNGDMLFSDRGTKLRRIHGAFLSDDEVHRVVDFLKAQAKPVYDMEILRPRDEEGEGDGAPVEQFHDALYDQAVAIVCETRQASVSFIQRRLQIGYNRAARMVEQMERDGIVGPANGIKPREVLAPAGDYLTSAS